MRSVKLNKLKVSAIIWHLKLNTFHSLITSYFAGKTGIINATEFCPFESNYTSPPSFASAKDSVEILQDIYDPIICLNI